MSSVVEGATCNATRQAFKRSKDMMLDDSRCLKEGSATCSAVHSVSGGISQTRSRHEDHMADNGECGFTFINNLLL